MPRNEVPIIKLSVASDLFYSFFKEVNAKGETKVQSKFLPSSAQFRILPHHKDRFGRLFTFSKKQKAKKQKSN